MRPIQIAVSLAQPMFYLLILVVLSALRDKVSAEQATALARMLPPRGFAVYIGVTEWVALSVVAVQQRLEDDIRHGALEPYLLRPKSYLLQRVAPAVGEIIAEWAVWLSRPHREIARRPEPGSVTA